MSDNTDVTPVRQMQPAACSPELLEQMRARSRDGLYAPQYDARFGHRLRGRRGFNLGRMRIKEIEKLIEARHDKVPDTDDGSQYIYFVGQHLREISHGDWTKELLTWCERWAPDTDDDQVAATIEEIEDAPRRFKADTIGKRLQVTSDERIELRLTTIGAVDETYEDRLLSRAASKKLRDRKSANSRRRKRGVRPRREYLTTALTRTRPWENEGISRRTWERRRRAART